MSGLPEVAFAAALTALPRMTWRRLRVLLRRLDGATAWAVATGDRACTDPLVVAVLAEVPTRGGSTLATAWRVHAGLGMVERVWRACQQGDIEVAVLGRSGYPPVLAADPQAPAVLFHRGSLEALTARRAGVVGTRNATAAGRDVAFAIARDLALAGVAVVSGLARGIDGAAHRGALSAPSVAPAAAELGPPVGVVAPGLDVVYPREHRALWDEVARRGVLLGEAPPGTGPEAFRFPLRNRILAALCEVVVVVESRPTGGSLVTVAEAQRRDVPVLAVPGSPRNRAAAGTNQLLRDGAGVAVDADDVLAVLSIDHRRCGRIELRPPPAPFAAHVLELLRDEPRTLDDLVAASGATLAAVALALGHLEADGWVVASGGWFEAADHTQSPR